VIVRRKKINTLLGLSAEYKEEVIKNVILNLYFPTYTYCNNYTLEFTIRYKKFKLLKIVGLPKFIYKRYYLILMYQNNELYKSITYKERKVIGELLNKIIFKDMRYHG
jgi:hypothetical protein